MLVIHIAHTEDAARYQGPVRFWNPQLNEVLGFRSPKSLNNARQKAVAGGWLKYQREHDRAVGNYWTTIPGSVLLFDDEPIEPIPSTERKSIPGTEQEHNSHSKHGTLCGTGSGTGNDLPSIPVPIPKEKRPRFVVPTLEDVKAYCTERRNKVNPEQFRDYYEANGWIQGKGKPIRNWEAAVRTWERNGIKNAKPTTDERDEYQDFTSQRKRA